MIKFILGRIGVALALAAVLATSAAIFVVALAFALYALVQPHVGAAGAAGIVAGAAALIVVFIAIAIALGAKSRPPKIAPKGKDPTARIINLFKEKPVMAIAAAVAAGFLAIRNPKYLGVAVRSFLEGREPPKRPR